jgi:hypothetical protein
MNGLVLRFLAGSLAFVIGIGVSGLTQFARQRLVEQRESVKSEVDLSASHKKTSESAAIANIPEYEFCVEGRYANFDYAYSVLVPKGMMAARNGIASNHGFGVDLLHPTSVSWVKERDSPKASLWADASYDSAEIGTPDGEIKESLKWLREKYAQVRLISKAPTRLGPLRAMRFVIAYEEGGEAMIEDQVVAFRSQLGDDSGIIYSIDLRTLASRYDRDKQAVVEMQRSWLIEPLPDNYPLPPVYEEHK